MGARHSHHVQLAGCDGVPRGGDVVDAGRVEDREVQLFPQLPRHIQVRGGLHALNRDQVGQPGVGFDIAAHDVQEINHAAVAQAPGDAEPFGLVDPALQHLIGGVSNADDELCPHSFSHSGEYVEDEPRPVLEIPAIGGVEPVGVRRPELIGEVPVRFNLHAVQTRRLHPFRRVGVVLDDAGDVPVLDHFGIGAVRRLPLRSRRDGGQPVALIPARAPPQMGQLDHHRRPGLMAFVGQLLHPSDDLILVSKDVVESGRAVARHRRRPRRHGHCDSGPRALRVIGAVTILRHPVLGVGRFMRGDEDPVAERQVFQLIGLEKRVVLHRSHFQRRRKLLRGEPESAIGGGAHPSFGLATPLAPPHPTGRPRFPPWRPSASGCHSASGIEELRVWKEVNATRSGTPQPRGGRCGKPCFLSPDAPFPLPPLFNCP